MERDSGATNQRIQFDAEPCGRHVLTGGTDGVVRVRKRMNQQICSLFA